MAGFTMSTMSSSSSSSSSFFLLLVILMALLNFQSSTTTVHAVPVFDELAFEIYQDNPHDVTAVMNFLFPNKTSTLAEFTMRQTHQMKKKAEREAAKELANKNKDNIISNLFEAALPEGSSEQRQLAVVKQAYDNTTGVSCAKCVGLKQCKALNTFMIQEKYYPSTDADSAVTETCNVIEDFGERISTLIFGNGRTFRDTVVCRDIVMQYLCLFYGSDSAMYTNYCVYQEESTDADQQTTKLAPRPPCRTFCTQVASVCANSPTFIQTCLQIACPPTETTCTPNPSVNGSTIDVPLDCYLPTYRNPYVRSGSPSSQLVSPAAAGAGFMLTSYLLLFYDLM